MEDDGDGERHGQEDLYTTFAAQAGHSDAIAKHDYGLSNWDMRGVTADQFEDQNEASQRVHIFFGVYGAAVINVSVNMSDTKASIRWKTDQPSGILVWLFKEKLETFNKLKVFCLVCVLVNFLQKNHTAPLLTCHLIS